MRVLTILLLAALAAPAAAQEREIRSANLPPELEWELLRMYEGRAERYDGPTTIERGRVVRGDVAAMGGPLVVRGRVAGDLAMVGGDVMIEAGGSVAGRVTVVGGEVRLADGAEVGGTITAYAASGRSLARPDREQEDDWVWWKRRRDDYRDHGFSRLVVRAGSGYNRVEGLPVMFGPVIRTGGPAPLRLEALAIWRTESESLDTDRMGYRVELEQFLDRSRRYGLGGSVYSVVDPLDRWQISDLEASLATVLFHQDYRDHYDRTGWSVFARAEPVRGLEARLEYRQEEHGALAAGDPWSLFHEDDDWRPQPLVAEGDVRSVVGAVELDFRDDDEDPTRGWYGRLAVQRPVGGDLVRPALLDVVPSGAAPGALPDFLPAREAGTDFFTGQLDLRRYLRVGWDSQLILRAVAGGSLDGTALPPQFQHALGGIGTLPGFPTFHADCGARSLAGGRGASTYFPAYGCDRFALAQVEYRGNLALDFGIGEPDYYDDEWWGYVDIDLSPTWAVFFDAGQGWAYEDPTRGPDRDTGLLLDAGLGFLLGDLGIYAALPLNGDVEQEPRFFVRLGRRF
ncbi:MAG: hypothetical protein ACLFRX_11020 [Gemmatimonadota bacterium]